MQIVSYNLHVILNLFYGENKIVVNLSSAELA